MFIKVYTHKPDIQGPSLCVLNEFFVFSLPWEVLLLWENLRFCKRSLLKAWGTCAPRGSSELKGPSFSGVGVGNTLARPLTSLGSELSESIVSRELFCSYNISDFIHSPTAKSGWVCFFHQWVPGWEEGFAHCTNLSSDILLKHETVSERRTTP